LSTKVQHRDGPICMSVEAAVMAAEQRDRRGRPSG
jgi:hypothetical protein